MDSSHLSTVKNQEVPATDAYPLVATCWALPFLPSLIEESAIRDPRILQCLEATLRDWAEKDIAGMLKCILTEELA